MQATPPFITDKNSVVLIFTMTVKAASPQLPEPGRLAQTQ